MKWKILSAVVALHLVVGGGLLLSGGCKNPVPASPKNSTGTANNGLSPSPVAPPVVTSTDTGAPIVNPGATTVIDTSPPVSPGNPNSINNNGLGSAINGQPTGVSTSYTVVKGDNLSRIAKKHGTSIKALQEANQLTSAELKIGQTLSIPAGDLSSSGLPNVEGISAPALGETTDYTVAKGDSLDRIAKKTGVSVAELKAANKLKSDTIQLGQTIKIPGKHDLKSLAAPAPRKGGLGTVPGTFTAPPPDGASTYSVKAGDTPEGIAKRHGMTTKELLALNGNLDPKKLQVGQKLAVKGGAGASPDSATPIPSTPVPAKSEPATPVPATPSAPGALPLINFGPSTTPPPATPTPAAPVPATPVPGNSGEALPITPVTN